MNATSTNSNNRPSPPDDSTPRSVDEIVDDLSQQDVLPSDIGATDEPDEVLSDGLDQTGSWDEAIGEHGHRAPKAPLDDDANYAETLVSDGLEEADEELRELDETDEETQDEPDSL